MKEIDQNKRIVSEKGSFKDIFFSSKGRLSGREYALYIACLSLGYFLACFIAGLMFGFIIGLRGGTLDNVTTYGRIATLLLGIPYIIMEIIISIKRAHDFGKSGNYIRRLLIPLYNIYIGLQLLIQKGDEKQNEYGNIRQAFSTGKKLLTVALYIIYVIITVVLNNYN